MVRLRWLYGSCLLLALLLAAVPSTREAGWRWAWSNVAKPDRRLGGLWFPEPLDGRTTALAIGAPWALTAACEGIQRLDADLRERMEEAVAEHPEDHLSTRRCAAIAVGQLADRASREPADELATEALAWARSSVERALESEPGNGYLHLLEACVAAADGRWEEAQQALADSRSAPAYAPGYGESQLHLGEVYRRAGLPAAEAAVTTLWAHSPAETGALRQMARRVANNAETIRKSGDLSRAAIMLANLAHAGDRLQRRPDCYVLYGVGRSVVRAAFAGAADERPDSPSADDDTLPERAAEFAALMRATGREHEARWALAEPARRSQCNAVLREARLAGRWQRTEAAFEQLRLWDRLARALAGAALFVPLYAWLLAGAGKPWPVIGWRWSQVLPWTLAIAGWGVVHAWRLVPDVTEGCLCDSGVSVESLAFDLSLVWLAVMLPLAWLLGWLHARRAEPRRGWARFQLTRRTATRMMVVPLFTLQAILLLLTLACVAPMASCRRSMAAGLDGGQAERAVLAEVAAAAESVRW